MYVRYHLIRIQCVAKIHMYGDNLTIQIIQIRFHTTIFSWYQTQFIRLPTFIVGRIIPSIFSSVHTYMTCLMQSIFMLKRLHLDILFGGHIKHRILNSSLMMRSTILSYHFHPCAQWMIINISHKSINIKILSFKFIELYWN